MKICKRCGACCQTETLLKNSSWKVKLGRLLIILLRYKSLKSLMTKPKCGHLRFNSKGRAYCLIYASRPQFCRNYYCEKC